MRRADSVRKNKIDQPNLTPFAKSRNPLRRLRRARHRVSQGAGRFQTVLAIALDCRKPIENLHIHSPIKRVRRFQRRGASPLAALPRFETIADGIALAG
jgi:hypothetical protein